MKKQAQCLRHPSSFCLDPFSYILPPMPDLADAAHELLEQQTRSWEMLRTNRQAVAATQVRGFDFGAFSIHAQLNPVRGRLVNSKVDPASILARPCFLCDANRPVEQVGLAWKHGFKILCNPFPILPEHFTIVHTQHLPQRILPSIGVLLELAVELSGRYTVLYNGPQCGASAPDHLHFQAGPIDFMPMDLDYENVKQFILESAGVRIFGGRECLRQFISFESRDAMSLERAFVEHYQRLQHFQPDALEPMMNIMCRYQRGAWRLLAFLRVRHRPDHFDAPEPARIVVSPGCIDMAGILVFPRAGDFQRITRDQIVHIYRQVTFSDQQFLQIAPFPGTRESQ